MDDVPPSPTSPGPRRPTLSVVIPVHNGGSDFERCLRRLRDSLGIAFELIVVDDESTDGSSDLARSFGARVLTQSPRRGPASARNAGAREAATEFVFFIDADVAVHPETLARAMARFDLDPGLTALFGSYDDQPEAPGLISRFRNLLHHFVHQQGRFTDDVRPARTFWTGCGMIRRDAFLKIGGFDPKLYARPAIEDVELGYRLTRAGHRIILARDVQATHLKRWTLSSIIRTDVLQRGVPWLILLKRLGERESDLNVKPGQKVCVAATGLAVLSAAAAPWLPWLSALAVLNVLTVVGLNFAFYRFLARGRGLGFAVGSVPMHLLYYGCCAASVALATAHWHFSLRSSRRRTPLAGPWERRRKAKADALRRDRPSTIRSDR